MSCEFNLCTILFQGGGTGSEPNPEEVSEDAQCNLQHISEREPDDLDQDPSLHPTAGPLFLTKSRQVIESEYFLCFCFLFCPDYKAD